MLKLSFFPREVARAGIYEQIGKKRIDNKKRRSNKNCLRNSTEGFWRWMRKQWRERSGWNRGSLSRRGGDIGTVILPVLCEEMTHFIIRIIRRMRGYTRWANGGEMRVRTWTRNYRTPGSISL